MKGLAGRRVIVTGGAAGIGAATADVLRRAGVAVAVLDHAPDTVERVDGPAFVADIGDAASLDVAVEAATRELGGLDGLVNNAGGVMGRPAPMDEYDIGGFTEDLRLNVSGTLAATKAAVARFAGRGSVVNVASLQAINASPSLLGYGAAKAAVVQLTKSLALELAPRQVRVNAVAPALTLTPAAQSGLTPERKAASIAAIPLGHAAEPEDIGEVIAFLLSDSARFVTGQLVVADGGLSLTSARPHRGIVP